MSSIYEIPVHRIDGSPSTLGNYQGKVLLIDASAMSTLMKKNLGKKRREFTPDCVERIAKAYADFQSMEWKENPAGKGGRVLKAKVFDRDHFC